MITSVKTTISSQIEVAKEKCFSSWPCHLWNVLHLNYYIIWDSFYLSKYVFGYSFSFTSFFNSIPIILMANIKLSSQLSITQFLEDKNIIKYYIYHIIFIYHFYWKIKIYARTFLIRLHIIIGFLIKLNVICIKLNFICIKLNFICIKLNTLNE